MSKNIDFNKLAGIDDEADDMSESFLKSLTSFKSTQHRLEGKLGRVLRCEGKPSSMAVNSIHAHMSILSIVARRAISNTNNIDHIMNLYRDIEDIRRSYDDVIIKKAGKSEKFNEIQESFLTLSDQFSSKYLDLKNDQSTPGLD